MNSPTTQTPARVFNRVPPANSFRNPAVTIGSFDGVHLGHRKILNTLKHRAEGMGGDTVVLTFMSHPRKVLNPGKSYPVLTTPREKVAAMDALGITGIILLDFTPSIAAMDALRFYNEILVEGIGAREIVIGYDHAFGKNREGDVNFLMRMAEVTGIHVTRVDEEHVNAKPVSSTWVRNEITAGNIHMANKLLARPYSMTGQVVPGVGRGSTLLGFPTANIEAEDHDKIIPCDGVYAVTVLTEDGTRHGGMLNIGTNPTFDGDRRTVEVNIFDLEKDLYGTWLTVEFHDWVRSEVRFASPVELVAQLEKDREKVKALLANHGMAGL